MNKHKRNLVLFALAATFTLLLGFLPPLPKSKPTPQRIQSVNHIAGLSFTLTGTNVSTAKPGK